MQFHSKPLQSVPKQILVNATSITDSCIVAILNRAQFKCLFGSYWKLVYILCNKQLYKFIFIPLWTGDCSILMESPETYNEYEWTFIVPLIQVQIQYNHSYYQSCTSSVSYHVKLILFTEMVSDLCRTGTSLTPERFPHYQETQECSVPFKAAHHFNVLGYLFIFVTKQVLLTWKKEFISVKQIHWLWIQEFHNWNMLIS